MKSKMIQLLVSCSLFACGGIGDADLPEDSMGELVSGVSPNGVLYGRAAEDDPIRQAIMRGELTLADLTQSEDPELAEKTNTLSRFGIGPSEGGTNCADPAVDCAPKCPHNHSHQVGPLGDLVAFPFPYQSCGIPSNKLIKWKWTGSPSPSTARAQFVLAAPDACADINNGGTWTCSTTTGSSQDLVFDTAISGPAIGLTVFQGSAGTVTSSEGPADHGWLQKYDGCWSMVDYAKIQATYPSSQWSPVTRNTIYHEMMHCQGLGHTNTSGYVMNKVMPGSSVALRINDSDKARFSAYKP